MNNPTPTNKDEIIALLSTKNDLLEIQDQIRILHANIYHKDDSDVSRLFDHAFSYEILQIIKEEMRASAVNLTNREAVRNYLDGLSKRLDGIKIYSLTVAFHPHANSIQLFSDYVKKVFGDMTVIDIAVNPEIMAGVIISFEGKYLDSSIGKKVSEIIDSKRDQIITTFKV